MVTLYRVLIGLLTSLLTASGLPLTQPQPIVVGQVEQTTYSPDAIRTSLLSGNLPIAAVQVDATPNATNTVIYIPQDHQIPGSNPSDPSNDTAVAVQQQISSIAGYLSGTGISHLVMAEGSLYGPVASGTISIVQNKLAASAALRQAAADIVHACTSKPCTDSANGALSIASELDREAALAGGGQLAKASGSTFTLWGAEDPAVQTKAGEIVRDYVYLGDRLSQLSSSTKPSGVESAPQLQMQNPLLSMLSSMMQPRTPVLDDQEIASLTSLAANSKDAALQKSAAELSRAYASATSAEQASEASLAQAASGLPSRSDNPYASVNDTTLLQSKLATVENEVQNTIVDERNSIASQHVADALAQSDQESGVLIYGAGHTAGLIKDLQAEGMNVVVVVPQALGSDQTLQQALAS